MTGVRAKKASRGAKSLSELCIEFDGRQLTVGTDVPEIREFLTHEYSAMLVPEEKSSMGRLDVLRSGNGYAVRGSREVGHAPSLRYLFESMKAEILFHFISTRQDLMWVHAGGVERAGKAVLFAGPSGNGKSTLVTLLCERDWRFLSDDIAPIRMNADVVLPFPQTPRRRIHPRREVPPNAIGIIEREAVMIDPEHVQRGPAAIGAIVFPAYSAGAAAELSRVTPGDAAFKLIRDCTNFADHKGAAVSRAAGIARTVPVYALTYSSGPGAASLVDSHDHGVRRAQD
ncbi:MAG TPA: hypothetical protein VES88_05185 [Gemmatimonadaceae bacterium]|nr:hypothetical protein [Gemmatimonadaceae bacterium]